MRWKIASLILGVLIIALLIGLNWFGSVYDNKSVAEVSGISSEKNNGLGLNENKSLLEKLKQDVDAASTYQQLPRNIAKYLMTGASVDVLDPFVNDEEARVILLKSIDEVPYFNSNDVEDLLSNTVTDKSYEERLEELKKRKNEQAIDWDSELENKISRFISENHKFYNETIGWGRYRKDVDWSQQAQQTEKILKEIEELLPAIDERIETMKEQGLIVDGDVPPHDPRGLKKDLEQNLTYSLKKAIDEQNTNQLLYNHQIFHSLDMAFNGYKSKDNWHSSFYASGY